MSIIQEIESMKYRFVLDLIKNEESYDKNKNVITGIDAFNRYFKRYKLMQEILEPLKNKLGDEIDVTDINFVSSDVDEIGIIVKYTKNDEQYLLSVSNIDYVDVSIVASDTRLQGDDFKQNNYKMLLRTFRNISDYEIGKESIIKSTTKKFNIKDNGDTFSIEDSYGKFFSIESKYSIYEKSNSLFNSIKINCNYPKLKEILTNENNIILLYNNLHFYENSFPKQVTKKLTYC